MKNLVAISDIHGQYTLMVDLLSAHGVIDNSNHWTFGEGHLVVVGDVFDRGGDVLDILWLVYNLEKEAEMEGGMVHYLIGNHEVMNLGNDLRYVNKKYRYTTIMLRKPYPQLFGPDTSLGRWIRSKPVAISINDMVFVHAGFSETCLDLDLSFGEINTTFQERIIDQPEEYIQADPILRVLTGADGPLWSRGYFNETFTKAGHRHCSSGLEKNTLSSGIPRFPKSPPFLSERSSG
ncbi:MAG: metallophosphoesterase [Saprospirales bacterium]|nr:metallophosphoesterase [Saprospirales bacterium]